MRRSEGGRDRGEGKREGGRKDNAILHNTIQ